MPSVPGRQSSRPEAFEGRQFNFCRNTLCANFGVAPRDFVGSGRRRKDGDGYRLSGEKTNRGLTCLLCGNGIRIKNNRAAVQEFQRYLIHLKPSTELRCAQPSCAELPPQIQRFGKTPTGSPRYRCKACGRTFSTPLHANWKQKAPDKNEFILRLLVNKMPMRRMVEVAGVSPSTLYRKLTFAYTQCKQFAARHEAKLPTMALGHVRLGTDKQVYLINWGTHLDRRNFALNALITADNRTGFVFAVHPNFDADVDPMTVERDARQRGDNEKEPIHRYYARLWLACDYLASAERPVPSRGHLRSEQTATEKSEEAPVELTRELKRPTRGMQVRLDYVHFGHFQYLRHLLQSATSFSLSVDPDSGLRQAAIAVFSDRIAAGQCRVFELDVAKELSVMEKDLAVMLAKNRLDQVRQQFSGMSRDAAGIYVVTNQLSKLQGQRDDGKPVWIDQPLPNRAEPRMRVLHATPRIDEDIYGVAQDIVEATIRYTDLFFMIVRRRLSLLERPIKTPSSASRTWHAYSPYDPAVACRVLEILRVVFNYHMVGKDKQTPAMRLGLCDRPYSLTEILAEPRAAPVRSPKKQTA